jgi:hypothetical protein
MAYLKDSVAAEAALANQGPCDCCRTGGCQHGCRCAALSSPPSAGEPK